MSWKLIQSIQKKTDLRLILPFGLSVKLGDVINVGRDGNFALEGSCKSILEMSAGKPRQADNGKGDLMIQSGKEAKYVFRGEGSASSFFPQVPSAHGGFDVSFGKADSWILALKGRTIDSLSELNRFRHPIVTSFERGVWKPEWALVTSVARVERMTLLASTSAKTQVSLSLGAKINPAADLAAKLTSDISIVAANQEFTHYITPKPMIAFCTAIRVKDSFWRGYDIGTLNEATPKKKPVDKMKDRDFWEDIDKVWSG